MHPASVARGGGKAINVSLGRLIDRNTEALDVLLPDALHAVPLTPDESAVLFMLYFIRSLQETIKLF